MPKSRTAAGVRFWICEEGHLHVSLHDRAGNEFASGAVDPEKTVDMVFKLNDELDELYRDEVSEDHPDDTIGPTVGNA